MSITKFDIEHCYADSNLAARLAEVIDRIGCGCGGDYGLCAECRTVVEGSVINESRPREGA